MPKRERTLMPRSPSPRSSTSADSDNGSDEGSSNPQQQEGVEEPGVNDVISGRGDTINRHPGNVQFRKMVEEKRRVYLSSHFKREKRLIAETIVANIGALEPPGRFLSKDPKTGLWFSIGQDRAREKASQALRENSKKIRAEIHQADVLRKREHNEVLVPDESNTNHADCAHSHRSTAGKTGPFDSHHYPYPPPPGPGWGYPYYYGYGPHQVPPYPLPVFHPYPPRPHHMPPGPTVYGHGYPEAASYGAHQKQPDYEAGRQDSPYKSDSSEDDIRVQLIQDGPTRCFDDAHCERTEPQQLMGPVPVQAYAGHNGFKHRRVEPLTEQAGRRRANVNSQQQEKQPSSSYPPKRPRSPGQGQPVMPTLELDGPNNEGTTQKLTLPYPTKSHRNGVLQQSHDRHDSSSMTPSTIPGNTDDKTSLPSLSFSIKSPHNGNFGHPRGGHFEGPSSNHTLNSHHHHHHHLTDNPALTPAAATCIAALDEILGSPRTDNEDVSSDASMGYAQSPGQQTQSPLAAPSGSNNNNKDAAVPFSPIYAQMERIKSNCPRTSLKPRPFY